MSPRVRKAALAVHLLVSVGWIGAVLAYLAVALAVPLAADPPVTRAAWVAMELIGWWAVVPLALLTCTTGVVMAVGTRWGLFRHYWTVVSLAATLVLTVVLLLHMPDVSHLADRARNTPDSELSALGSDIAHPSIGLVGLLGVFLLNTYKPRGVTRYGWRRSRTDTRG